MDERSGRRAPRRSFGGWPRRGCARDAGFEGEGHGRAVAGLRRAELDAGERGWSRGS